MKEFYSMSKLFYDLFIKNCKFIDIILGVFSFPLFFLLFVLIKLDDLWGWIIKRKRNGQ